MKYKNLIFIAIVAFTTLVGSWVIPSLAQKMTDEYGKKADEYFAKKEKDIMTI